MATQAVLPTSRRVMTAISLREAAKQLRETAEKRMIYARQKTAASADAPIARRDLALARLLDGDGEGGLLGEHWTTKAPWGGELVECCGRCSYGDGVPYRKPCPTLTLVAAYVSSVLGVEVVP